MNNENDILLNEIKKNPDIPYIAAEDENTTKCDEESTSEIDNLINNIKQQNKQTLNPIIEVDKNQLEQFTINYASQLVKDSVEYISELKNNFGLNSSTEDIEAFASATKAAAAAVEALNKMSITKQKIDASIKLQNDKLKLKLEDHDNEKITITRDDLFKFLTKQKINNNNKLENNDIVEID